MHHTTFIYICQRRDFTTATPTSPTPTYIGAHPSPFLQWGGAHDLPHPRNHRFHHFRRWWCPSTSANSKYSRCKEIFSCHGHAVKNWLRQNSWNVEWIKLSYQRRESAIEHGTIEVDCIRQGWIVFIDQPKSSLVGNPLIVIEQVFGAESQQCLSN